MVHLITRIDSFLDFLHTHKAYLEYGSVLALIGALVVLQRLFVVVFGLAKTFLRPAKNLRKYGQWAVVTGATGAEQTLHTRTHDGTLALTSAIHIAICCIHNRWDWARAELRARKARSECAADLSH